MNLIKFLTSLLTFYLKGEINAGKESVEFKVPKTLLGFIPMGYDKDSVPVNQLVSACSSSKLNIGNLIVALVLIAASVAGFIIGGTALIIAAAVVLVIALNLILCAFETHLTVNMTGGVTKDVCFFVLDKAKATRAEILINRNVSARTKK